MSQATGLQADDYVRVWRRCARCNGTGADLAADDSALCLRCDGVGRVEAWATVGELAEALAAVYLGAGGAHKPATRPRPGRRAS